MHNKVPDKKGGELLCVAAFTATEDKRTLEISYAKGSTINEEARLTLLPMMLWLSFTFKTLNSSLQQPSVASMPHLLQLSFLIRLTE